MNRREFIAKSSTTALSIYLTSCTSKQISAPAEQFEGAKRDLSKIVSGKVMGVGDPGFQTAITIDNGRINRSPFLVVTPLSTKDIANTVKYCRTHSIRLTTKSGGHSAAGYCLNSDGIVLDMSQMNSIQPRNGGESLSVGTGTRWIQLYNYVEQNLRDRIVVGGGCAGVGVGGFILGGGYSFISRSYGMGCDNVKAMEFVSADGEIFKLDENLTNTNERDLYWALRGAGGGNFGIVSNVELKSHRRRTTAMIMGSITFPIERASEVLHFYNTWMTTLPHEMAAYGMIRRMPDPTHGGEPRLAVVFTPIYNGHTSEGTALLKPLIDMSPLNVELYTMTLPQWESFMGTGTAIHGRSAYMRSAVMAPKSLNDEVIAILVKHMNEAPNKDSFVVWTQGGGKIRDLKDNSNCYPHRDAEIIIELKSIWESNEPQKRQANVEWAVKFIDELEAHAQGAYANYIDPLLENWQQKYYRGSYKRLVEIKSHWDANGFFNFQQGIGSNFSPNRTRPLDMSPLDKT
jgi:hypothetical protein